MFSKVLVKLTSVFLILYTPVTSATPVSTSKAQNTNDDIQSLAPRGDLLFDPPIQCPYPYTWSHRECVGDSADNGSTEWQDVCGHFHPFKGMLYKYTLGECPNSSTCFDTVTYGKKHQVVNSIVCMPNKGKGKGRGKINAQTGTSKPATADEVGDTQFELSVTIDHKMDGASVAAVLKSECRTVNVHCHMLFLCSCSRINS